MNDTEAIEAAERFAEQAGVPFTPWQLKVMEAVLKGDRDEVEYAAWYEPPLVTCVNLLNVNGRGMSMSSFDQALRDHYAPGLKAMLNQSRLLIAPKPKRRRFWYKPWTWRRKNIKGIAGRTATWTIRDEATSVPLLEDEFCPPNTAYLIDPSQVVYRDDPPFEWDQHYDRRYEEWHDMGGDA